MASGMWCLFVMVVVGVVVSDSGEELGAGDGSPSVSGCQLVTAMLELILDKQRCKCDYDVCDIATGLI